MATASLEQRYRGRSLWLDHAPGPLSPRPSLSGDAQFDVAVVGAGFTGLWTAYYVKRDRPDARVAVVEPEIAGFGPSGRNGGWVSARIAGSPSVYAERHGPEAVRRAERETFSTVDEIGRVAREERIDCGFEKAGTVDLAMTAPQVSRARSEIDAARRIGLGEDDVRVLEASELEQLVCVPGCRLALYSPHSARIDPGAAGEGSGRGMRTRRRGHLRADRSAAGRPGAGAVPPGHTDRGPRPSRHGVVHHRAGGREAPLPPPLQPDDRDRAVVGGDLAGARLA